MYISIFHLKSGEKAIVNTGGIIEEILENSQIEVRNFKDEIEKIVPSRLWFNAPYFYKGSILHYIWYGKCRETMINMLLKSRGHSSKTRPRNTMPEDYLEKNISLLKFSLMFPETCEKENLEISIPKFFRMMHRFIDCDSTTTMEKSKVQFNEDFRFNLYQMGNKNYNVDIAYPLDGKGGENQAFIFHSLFILLFKSLLWITPTGEFKNPSLIFGEWKDAIKLGYFNSPHILEVDRMLHVTNFIMFTLIVFVRSERLSLRSNMKIGVYCTGPIAFFGKYSPIVAGIFFNHNLWGQISDCIDLNRACLPDDFIASLLRFREKPDTEVCSLKTIDLGVGDAILD